MLFATFAIILCLAALSVHELGHAWAMLKVGVPVKRISLIGVPLGKLPRLSFTARLAKGHEPTTLELHPLVIGAFAEPDERRFKAASPADRAFVYGMGPVTSIALALVLFAIAGSLRGADIVLTGQSVPSAVLIVIALALIAFARFAAIYLVVPLGLLLVWVILSYILASPAENITTAVGGPVSVVETFGGQYTAMAHTGGELSAAFGVAGSLSLALGTVNALPFMPLDGGQVGRMHIARWLPKYEGHYAGVSVSFFFLLIALALVGDIATFFD